MVLVWWPPDENQKSDIWPNETKSVSLFSKNFRWLISFYSGTEKKWIPKSPASDWPVQGFCLKNKSSQVKPTDHEPATVRMAINCRQPNFYDSRFHEFLNGPFMTIGQFIIRTRTGPRRSIFFRKVVNSITMEASFHRRWSTDQLRLDRNCKSRSAWLFFVHYHESHRWWTHSGPAKMSFRVFFSLIFAQMRLFVIWFAVVRKLKKTKWPFLILECPMPCHACDTPEFCPSLQYDMILRDIQQSFPLTPSLPPLPPSPYGFVGKNCPGPVAIWIESQSCEPLLKRKTFIHQLQKV